MKFFILVLLIFSVNAVEAKVNSCRAEYSEKNSNDVYMGKALKSVTLTPNLEMQNMEIGIFKIKVGKLESPIGDVFTIEVNHNSSQSYSAYPLDTEIPFTVITDGNFRVRVVCSGKNH